MRRANIYAGADFRISQVGEVIGFRAAAEAHLLHLDEVPHMRTFTNLASRT